MKVVAFNGSPNSEGNTYHAIKMVAEELENKDIETEIIQVGNKEIRGCLSCNKCVKNQNEKCIIDDQVNDWIQKLKESDGIIIGSPVHYAAIAGTMKSFLDRAFYVASVNGMMLRHKVGAPVVAVRRSGGMPTFNQLSNYINYSEMMMPTSNYWSVIHGTTPGEAEKDEEGKQIMRILGKNMAYLMEVMENAEGEVEAPEAERKKLMNFIR
ncbi:MAG: iron-sulfur flavoprotein [Halanaerobium sp. 4-GBenrich]|jgi:multimeric flavodoxin WrbA|uniref:Multimeric flavodoxin WrbA n=1 Tax=Halanaerobium congolense TaxID=54121 RepID=A0A1G6M596_9FIRM|nr:flavodoxin family protein [Halanaerobium congolense]KXS48359.1 MAG: iron-sulfur flavoprotein [Halanaerobium sp. T82-1]ODS50403.1 MAG: iron-sulfur flavoprotein [Halanaerobium sp. 4-GBenrich]OEG62790.1 MAG: FMN reductase [Halanaerobium sp. MDAL1]PTX16598.1 multimeric flavodoxin WrbA [Halanaerobium congolense]PXV65363.1 multimeric flavodoxin WrbA [Halanaerobium congolense]